MDQDLLGEDFASGDFDGDGFVDVGVGAVGEDIGAIVDAGAANVVYGTANGLATPRNRLFHQGNLPGGSPPEEEDFFGAELAG
jgi:hypothetical protein